MSYIEHPHSDNPFFEQMKDQPSSSLIREPGDALPGQQTFGDIYARVEEVPVNLSEIVKEFNESQANNYRQGPFPPREKISFEQQMESYLAKILEYFAGMPLEDNPHLEKTPERFFKMLEEMCTPQDFAFTTFPSTSDEMITLGPIPFYTLCAHHVVPFFGNAYVGYVPKDVVAGLSKIPRLVKNLSKGFHVQEELTGMIADGLEAELEPRGVAVVMKAEHLCMAMRGVEQPGVITTTSAMRGVFSDHTRTAKAEFMKGVPGA